jgi:putative endonuclease
VPSEKRKFGDIGEKIAEKWLNNKGFSILERNYLKKWGEIDIVAKNKGVLRFIEVKTVKKDLLSGIKNDEYRPEENVHAKKLERLHRAIQSYLMERGGGEEDWQLDVVAVYIDEPHKLAKVEMMENIVG